MSGIRVSYLPDGTTTKDIKIYFSKPENGGGEIQNIYYPLFNDDAVVIFKDKHVARMVSSHKDDTGLLRDAELQTLPETQMYLSLTADLESFIADFLEATPQVLDELQYYLNLTYKYDAERKVSTLHGNWYQLECAWKHIEDITLQQTKAVGRLQQPFRYRAYEMEVEEQRALQEEEKDSQRRGEYMRARGNSPTRGDSPSRREDSPRQEDSYRRRGDSPRRGDYSSKREDSPGKEYSPRGREDSPEAILSSEMRSLTTRSPDPATQWRSTKGRDELSDQSDDDQSDDSLTKGEEERNTEGKDRDGSRGTVATRIKHSTSDEEDDRDTSSPGGGRPAAKDDRDTPRPGGGGLAADRGRVSAGATKAGQMTEILNDRPEDPRSLDFRHGPIHVSIFTGNITLAETDAIVNASNSTLEHYGGVAAAIESKADPKLVVECRQYVRDHGHLKTADVMHTSAGGKLSDKVKYVIHAVGPLMSEVFKDKSIHELTRTFLNVMTYANKHLKVKSITVPLISSGVFGGELETCVKAFLDAVLIFVSEHCSGEVNLSEVNLINNNADSTVQTVLCVRQCLDTGLDKLTKEAVQQFEEMSLKASEDVTLRRNRAGRDDFSHSLHADRHRSVPAFPYESDRSRLLFSSSVRYSPLQPSSGSTGFQRSMSNQEQTSGYSSLPQSAGTVGSQSGMRSLSSSRSTGAITKPPTTGIKFGSGSKSGLSTAVSGATPHTQGRPLTLAPSQPIRDYSSKYSTYKFK